MTALGSYLKVVREKNRMSIRGTAQRCGVSAEYLSALESGRNRGTGKASQPSPDMLRKIAHGYGVPYWRLMNICGYLPDELSPAVMEVLSDPRNKVVLSMFENPDDLQKTVRIIKAVLGEE